jgi:hypothetical protein
MKSKRFLIQMVEGLHVISWKLPSKQGVVFKYKKKTLRLLYETRIIQDMTYPRADGINQDGNQDSQ